MQIHLDSPNRGYLPGALVQGEIELGAENDGEEGVLSVVFSGRSMIELKAWSVGPGDYNTSTQFLVQSRQVLYEGSLPFTSMPPGGWPFLFTFPSKPHSDLGQEIWTNASIKSGCPRDWSCDHAMISLPRSFKLSAGPIYSACVEYRLEARWISATQRARDLVVLPFDTYRRSEEPEESFFPAVERFSLRSSLLPREKSTVCPLTLKDKLHLAVGHEGITRTEFNIETKVRTTLVQGDVLPIEQMVIYVSERSTTAKVPTVSLASFTVGIEETTAVRTLRRAVSHTDTVTLGSCDSLDVPFEGSEPINISERLGLSTEHISYDIDTFNIRQSHDACLSFTVECMGQYFDFHQKIRLNILSPFYEESPPGIMEC